MLSKEKKNLRMSTNNISHSTPTKNLPKRRRAVYNLMATFTSRTECDTHLRTISKYGYTTKHNNGPVNCTLCDYNMA